MRRILTATAILGFLIAIASHSPGVLALGVCLGLTCGVGTALSFIDLHIQASSRSEYMSPGELDALKASLKRSSPGADSAPGLPPPAPE